MDKFDTRCKKIYNSLEMKMAFVSSFNARTVSMIVFKKYGNLSKVLIKLVTECKKINLVKNILGHVVALEINNSDTPINQTITNR